MFEALFQISQIVSVGSVDGVCTSAALLCLIGRSDLGLQFAQAFTVDKVDPMKWAAGRKVAFVDLAVNNRDPSMTADFVRRIREAGHEIVAVIDEHNRADWLKILGSFEGLIIEPQSQDEGIYKSSGAVLKAALGSEAGQHSVELMDAADAGDHMDFSTHFGEIVNQAVKSDIGNDARRVYLAQHFALNYEPDETIRGWMAEYEEILRNHDQIVAEKVDLGDGIHRVNAVDLQVDMTTLMSRLYSEKARVVALYGDAFVPAEKRKRVVLSLGTNDKGLDLMAIVRAAGITPLGGFAQKVNIELGDERTAIAAIRAALA